MSRPLRIERAGGWYHLTSRGNERRAIDRDNRDRAHFCELLGEMVARFRVRLHGFVLMDNRYHLILELNEANLSRTGQWLNVSDSVWFNRRRGRSGHLFQDQVVLGGETFLQQLRAQVRGNPREQRGVRRLARPRPKLEEVIANVEKVKGRSWEEIRDWYGDDGRDLVLHLGRRACGLKLGELAAATGMTGYEAVSAALRRRERRLQRSRSGRERLKQVSQMSNVEM